MYIVFQVNVTSTNTMKTLDNLRPFTSYTCTIHAVTVSDGPLSDPITVTTAEQGIAVPVRIYITIIVYLLVPTAPAVKGITAIDSESVHIEWNIPTNINGILTNYTISYTIENGSERNVTVPFNGQNVSNTDN